MSAEEEYQEKYIPPKEEAAPTLNPAAPSNQNSPNIPPQEKIAPPTQNKTSNESGEESEEDIDQLIDDLQSNRDIDEEASVESDQAMGGPRVVPEEMLQTDPNMGLTSDEVLRRRKKFGLNQMSEESENMFIKFLSYFIGPIQFVMEAAAILAAGLGDWVDFGVICGLLMLNACVGFIQEYQAGSIVEELKKTLANTAIVIRDSELVEVPANEVVPGDILQLDEGTIIPADGMIVTEDCFLQVDQSAIT